ncbi:MAG: hypothetical protein GF370_04330 [Candidatus Nealsonbacteria bacterium]|nr:hypothetical protein [Candidatus Nealsonbacteria bacterium]
MVEIIPKEEARITTRQKIMFGSLLFLVLGVLAIYGFISYQHQKTEEEFRVLEAELDAIRDPTILPLEKKIVDQKKRIDQIAPYLEDHIVSTRVFSLLESKAHPQVVFQKLDLDTKQQMLKISCVGDDFVAMGQQIEALKESPLVKELSAKQIGLEKEENKVSFNLEIILDKEIFQY